MARQPSQIFAIPYRFRVDALEVMVLHRRIERYWQFVAGGVERGESLEQAALRESSEELGVRIDAARLMKLDTVGSIPRYHFRESWPAALRVIPEQAFAVDCAGLEPKPDQEHDRFDWLAADQAYARLKYDSNRTGLWELCSRLGFACLPAELAAQSVSSPELS